MSAFDTQKLQELEAVLGDQLMDLLQLFQNESLALHDAIVAAVADKARDDLRLHAHSLKGASSNLGAMDLRRCCEQIERGATQAPIGELVVLCEELSVCHRSVMDELTQRLKVA